MQGDRCKLHRRKKIGVAQIDKDRRPKHKKSNMKEEEYTNDKKRIS